MDYVALLISDGFAFFYQPIAAYWELACQVIAKLQSAIIVISIPQSLIAPNLNPALSRLPERPLVPWSHPSYRLGLSPEPLLILSNLLRVAEIGRLADRIIWAGTRSTISSRRSTPQSPRRRQVKDRFFRMDLLLFRLCFCSLLFISR